MLAAVFPGAEPEQDQPQAMFAGLGQQRIDDAVIVMPFGGFELLPVDGHFHRIDAQVFHGRPYLRQHRRPGARIVNLSAQHEERRTIHEERITPVSAHQARDGALLHLGEQRHRHQGRQEHSDLLHPPASYRATSEYSRTVDAALPASGSAVRANPVPRRAAFTRRSSLSAGRQTRPWALCALAA
jgi:hypothetical protein